MEKRPALGKGLSALIPDAADALDDAARVARSRHRSARAQSLSAARPDRRRASSRSSRDRSGPTASSSRSSCASSTARSAGASATRSSPASAAGAPRSARSSPRSRSSSRTCAGGRTKRLLEMALIENIQREDLNPMEAAAGVSAAGRRIPPEAGRHRRAGRQGSRDGRQLPAPAEAAGRSARQRRVGRAVDGPRPRDRRAATESDQRRLARDVVVARPLGARDRSAGQERARHQARRRQAGRSRRRRTCTRARPKSNCASRSARRSRSSARARAARSRSRSRTKTSCSGSTNT